MPTDQKKFISSTDRGKRVWKGCITSLILLSDVPDLAAIEVIDELLEYDSASCLAGQVSSADSSGDRSLVAAAFGKVSEEPYPAETADAESCRDPADACLD